MKNLPQDSLAYKVSTMTAALNGAVIESTGKNPTSDSMYSTNLDPSWDWYSNFYRVKPELKVTPWTCKQAIGKTIVHHGDPAELYLIVRTGQCNGLDVAYVTPTSGNLVPYTMSLLADKTVWTQADGSPCGTVVA